MKKQTITITTLGLLAILSCGLVFHLSCNKENDCSSCQITQQEEAFLSEYNKGDIAIFKNDATGAIDTLSVTSKGTNLSYCSDPCSNIAGSISAEFGFYHNGYLLTVWHNSTPTISFPNFYCCNFSLSGVTQTMTINSTTYNDIYITSIDSTTIPDNTVPWKIDYSKSKGFVRFYMVHGQTWSKL